MKQILKALVGSRAYGTAVENSDYDYITAHVRNKDHYLGIKSREVYSAVQEGDTTDHEIRHFINMCCKFNPNIIIALWSPAVEVDKDWEWLIERRDLFTSKKAVTAFIGFSEGQIKQSGNGGSSGRLGSKRKDLIEKYGFDTKFAQNAIRLQIMLMGFQMGEYLLVKNSEDRASFLLDIRNGKYTLEQCNAFYKDNLKIIREYEKYYPLPEEPDYKEINRLMIQSMEKSLGLK